MAAAPLVLLAADRLRIRAPISQPPSMLPSRAMLNVLETWKEEEQSESLRESPPVVVQDFDWLNGMELLDTKLSARERKPTPISSRVKLAQGCRRSRFSENRHLPRRNASGTYGLSRHVPLAAVPTLQYFLNHRQHLKETHHGIRPKQSAVIESSRFRAAVWFFQLRALGCGSNVYQSAPVDEDKASETPTLVLDSWQEGETLTRFRNKHPKVVSSGFRLEQRHEADELRSCG